MENVRDLKECTTELIKIKENSKIVAAFIYGLKVGAETKEVAEDS